MFFTNFKPNINHLPSSPTSNPIIHLTQQTITPPQVQLFRSIHKSNFHKQQHTINSFQRRGTRFLTRATAATNPNNPARAWKICSCHTLELLTSSHHPCARASAAVAIAAAVRIVAGARPEKSPENSPPAESRRQREGSKYETEDRKEKTKNVENRRYANRVIYSRMCYFVLFVDVLVNT